MYQNTTASTREVSLLRQNAVLRNTYLLLAISMLPTIAGAWLGVTFNVMALLPGGFLGPILMLAVMFGFIFLIQRNRDSGAGVLLLLGFTFIMGIFLSGLLRSVLGFSNGPALIMMAFGGTAGIFAVMSGIAMVTKRDFSGMGRWLFMGVIGLIVASLMNMYFQIPALHLTILSLAILIFSAYLLYDVQQIVRGGETNYVSATLSIYLSLYNIFTSLLQLLGIFGGDD